MRLMLSIGLSLDQRVGQPPLLAWLDLRSTD
jgi:hypothetical protein